jgi:hypothetical protein
MVFLSIYSISVNILVKKKKSLHVNIFKLIPKIEFLFFDFQFLSCYYSIKILVLIKYYLMRHSFSLWHWAKFFF